MKHGILLEVVQVLTDLNLIIIKAYICCDGGWFMDGNKFPLLLSPPITIFFDFMKREIILYSFLLTVFNVTDHDGKKITDEGILNYIQKVSPFNWVKFLHLLLN